MRAHLYRLTQDAEGNLIANSTITVYDNGTTDVSALPLFTTDAGVEELTNPFTSENGEIEFYLDLPARVRLGIKGPLSEEQFFDDVDVQVLSSAAGDGGVSIEDEGVNVGTNVPILDFVGAGVSVAPGAGKVVVTVPGGAPSADEVSYAGSTNLAATDVEAALDELDAEKASVIKSINAQTGTSYTLALSDTGKFITLDNGSAISLIVPYHTDVDFPIGAAIDGAQLGAGQVTIAGAIGVVVLATPGLKVAAQNGTFGLLKIGIDTWLAYGRLAA